MGKGFFRGIVGIRWRVIKAQSMQLIWAPELTMAVVVTVFKVVGEIMRETGMYRECFLQFVNFGMTEKGGVWDGGVEGGEDSGVSVVGVDSEGVSGMGSTGRAIKRFEGRGEGVVDAGEVG